MTPNKHLRPIINKKNKALNKLKIYSTADIHHFYKRNQKYQKKKTKHMM